MSHIPNVTNASQDKLAAVQVVEPCCVQLISSELTIDASLNDSGKFGAGYPTL